MWWSWACREAVAGRHGQAVFASVVAVGLFASGSFFPVLGIGLSLLSPASLCGGSSASRQDDARPGFGAHDPDARGSAFVPAGDHLAGVRRPSGRAGGGSASWRPRRGRGGWSGSGPGGGGSSGARRRFGRLGASGPRHRAAPGRLLADMEALSRRVGIAEGPGRLEMPTRQLRSALLVAFPGLLFVGSLLTAAARLVFQAMVRRWPTQLGATPSAAFRWEMPELFVWGFIGSGLGFLTGIPWLKAIGVNGLIIFLSLYFLHGLSIAAFLFRRFHCLGPWRPCR